MRDIEAQLETRQLRRMRIEAKTQDRLNAKFDRQWVEAEALIGQLQREDGVHFYLNLRNRKGQFTGKTLESRREDTLIGYAIRNNYV
jgi:hypothetical protein